MKIRSIDKDIKDILESGFYRIPRFQRPYCWDLENIEDFWNDVVVNADANYFIGPMVVFKPPQADTAGVVDRISHAAGGLIFNSITAPSFTRIRSRTCRHQEIIRAFLKYCDAAGTRPFAVVPLFAKDAKNGAPDTLSPIHRGGRKPGPFCFGKKRRIPAAKAEPISSGLRYA